MSQRFIRCTHCGLPHDILTVVCPATGRSMNRNRGSSSSMLAAAPAPVPARMSPPPSSALARPSDLRAQRRASAVEPRSSRAAAPQQVPAMPPVAAPIVPPHGAPRTSTRDLIGKKIGDKYVVRSVLGEGGMGTVFEAEHEALGRSVAVKVLHPQQARKKDAIRRFHQEARAAGAIGHPNICEVYDLGTLHDGSPYLVMEKLVGETLADRIASEGGLPFDDVIDVLTQVLSGLVAAHEKRILHRDIKPENVFLTRRVGCPPVAKLLDFGVSKIYGPLFNDDQDLDLTRTGMVMGTPYYMSPEQARGDRNLDARVDLYACGVIMYEALTGRRPFTAANYNALLLQILTAKPRPARELRPALPPAFDLVIGKAMARAREDRYENAAEFQRDLQALRDRHGGLAARPAYSPPPSAVAKRTPVPSPRAVARAAPPARAVTRYALHAPVRPPSAPPARGPSPAPADPPPVAEDALETGSPSSVEIPVTFSPDTPHSGEEAADETEVYKRGTDLNLQPPVTEVLEWDDSDQTEVQSSPMLPVDEEHTTQRRGGELVSALRQVADEARRAKAPPPDEIDTLVKGTSKKRRSRPSPEDTIKMDGDFGGKLEEARRALEASDPPEPGPGKR